MIRGTTVTLKEFSEDKFLFMATSKGVVKKVRTSDCSNAKTRGIIAINLDEGDKIVSAILTDGSNELILVSRMGQALRITEEEVRFMGRASRGVCGLRISSDDELAGAVCVNSNEKMLLLTSYGYGKRVDFDDFMRHGRATGGQKGYNVTDKTGEVVGVISVTEKDEIMCITSQGKSLRVPANGISEQGRAAQGVHVLEINQPDMVIGVDKIAGNESEEEVDK